METKFTGKILGVEYADRAEFEKAARAAGWRPGATNRTGDWKVGLPVAFITDDGERLEGQVWSKADTRGDVCLALEGGRYAKVHTESRSGELIDSRGAKLAVFGKVGSR